MSMYLLARFVVVWLLAAGTLLAQAPQGWQHSHASVAQLRPARFWLPTAPGHTVLRMAYAQAPIANPQAWQAAGRVPTHLYLVYTAYPADTALWLTPYDSLQLARLAALYALEPRLRTVPLTLVAQTAPRSGRQAQQYFHGAVIAWDSTTATTPLVTQTFIPPTDTFFAQDTFVLPEALLSEQTLEARMEEVRGIIAGQVALRDPTVLAVLDRNPRWDSLLVVLDWTGSMHPYGGQLLHWLQAHTATKTISHLVLFNDGDDYLYTGTEPIGTRKKPVGETGGVYFVAPVQMDTILAAMRYVMRRGDGGDLPENDLEALLKARRRYPHHRGPVVLIADNGARIRDMSLVEAIDFPVHIILCGLMNTGVRPEYVELAWRTGGSVHTLRRDLRFKEPYQSFMLNKVSFEGREFKLSKAGVKWEIPIQLD
jgi:hypothetical protein